jgi:hypothetical protein
MELVSARATFPSLSALLLLLLLLLLLYVLLYSPTHVLTGNS